jgi:hypothetical protein
VIPDTLLGLLLFAAGVGPGYVFVWATERYEARPSRSPLLEAAQLVIVGGLTSLVAALIVLSVSDWRGWIDTDQIAAEPGDYLITEPGKSLGVLLAILLLSYGSAWLIAQLVNRGKEESILPGDPPWSVALSRDCPDDRAVGLTVELTDGRLVTGSLRSFSLGEEQAPSIQLVQPLFVSTPDGQEGRVPYEFFVVGADEIRCIVGNYRPGEPYRPGST